MKKKIVKVFIIALFIFGLIGIVWINYPILECGLYYTNDKESIIELKEDGTCIFFTHVLRSITPEGTYTVNGNILTLKTNWGDYEFVIKNKQLVFRKGNDITDGTVGKGEKYILDK